MSAPALVPVRPRGHGGTSLHALVPPFLTWLRFVRERGENTVKGYGFDLATFLEFCDRGGRLSRPDQVRVQHVEVFVAWLRRERGLQPSSVNRHVHALRAFWRWLIREEVAIRNPAADVALLKVGQRLPHRLTLAEQERALEPPPPGAGLHQRRTRAAIATGLLCGLRLDELRTLRLEHLNLDDGTLCVIGKGDKQREGVIIPRLATILREYVEQVRPRLLARGADIRLYHARGGWRAYYALRGKRVYFQAATRAAVTLKLKAGLDALAPEDRAVVGRCYVFRDPPWWGAYYDDLAGRRHFLITRRARTKAEARQRVAERMADLTVLHTSSYLFVRDAAWSRKHSGQPIPTRVLYAMIRRYLTPLLNRPVHPHMLRHSFASRLREHGAPIELIQEALGHADIQTTMIYAHLSNVKRRTDVARYLEGGDV